MKLLRMGLERGISVALLMKLIMILPIEPRIPKLSINASKNSMGAMISSPIIASVPNTLVKPPAVSMVFDVMYLIHGRPRWKNGSGSSLPTYGRSYMNSAIIMKKSTL